MIEYKVELIHFKITKMNVSIDMEEDTVVEIRNEYNAAIFEPNDLSDPTSLIKVDCFFKDASGKVVDVFCSAELVFSIDPVPENRVAVLQQETRALLHKLMTQRIIEILEKMGHSMAAS